jgi:hypothetical protein
VEVVPFANQAGYESCSYVSTLTPTNGSPLQWWWDYLRGRWPTYIQPRIIAGSNINGLLPQGWAAAHQKVLQAGKVVAERFYVLEGPANQTLPVSVPGGVPQQLVPGQYVEVQNVNGVDQLTNAAPYPGPGSNDPMNAGFFADYIKTDTQGRNLPQGVLCP